MQRDFFQSRGLTHHSLGTCPLYFQLVNFRLPPNRVETEHLTYVSQLFWLAFFPKASTSPPLRRQHPQFLPHPILDVRVGGGEPPDPPFGFSFGFCSLSSKLVQLTERFTSVRLC